MGRNPNLRRMKDKLPSYGIKTPRLDPNFKTAPPTHLPTRTTQTPILFITLPSTMLVPNYTNISAPLRFLNQTCKLDPNAFITQDPFHQVTKPTTILKLVKFQIKTNIEPLPI